MPSIRVNESVKAIVDACVADGAALSAAAFVEEAVQHYAASLYDDEDAVIAAAKEGIAAIERGEYVTIATQADRDALWERVNAKAKVLLDEMRASDPKGADLPRAVARAAE